MRYNVHIVGKKNGKIIAEHRGHNVWVDHGRSHLARLLAYQDIALEVPLEDNRVKYMSFGIGGILQSQLGISGVGDYAMDYPAAQDPNLTTGHEYRTDRPYDPPISTLERPVRITAGPDVWLKRLDIGASFDTVVTAGPGTAFAVAVQRCIIDATAGEMVFAPYDTFGMPISEIGLFHAGSDPTSQFNSVVPAPPDNRLGTMIAYHTFDTMLIVPGSVFEFTWKVEF